jgi:ATP-dependent Lon protease
MAALRHGIHTVIIPKDNERDLMEIDQTVRNALNFVVAETVDTVLNTALNGKSDMVPMILSDIPGNVKKKGSKPEIRQ